MKIPAFFSELKKIDTSDSVVYVSAPSFSREMFKMWSETAICNLSRMFDSVTMVSDSKGNSKNEMKNEIMWKIEDFASIVPFPDHILLVTVPNAHFERISEMKQEALHDLVHSNEALILYSDPKMKDRRRFWIPVELERNLDYAKMVILIQEPVKVGELRKTMVETMLSEFGKEFDSSLEQMTFRIGHNDGNDACLTNSITNADGKRVILCDVDSVPFNFKNYTKRIADIINLHYFGLQTITETLTQVVRRRNPSQLPSDIVKLIQKSDLVLGNDSQKLKQADSVIFISSSVIRNQTADELNFIRALCLKNSIPFKMVLIEDIEHFLTADRTLMADAV
jgi:hypothetical protein